MLAKLGSRQARRSVVLDSGPSWNGARFGLALQFSCGDTGYVCTVATGADLSLAIAGNSLLDQLPDCRFKRSKLEFDDVPDEGKVDAKVLVGQHVTGAGDPGPWDLWSLGRERFGAKVSNDLSDNFEVADHGVLGLAIKDEMLASFGV